MITSPDNSAVKQARALLEPKGRREQGRCLVEGVRLIEEALRAGIAPALLFFLSHAREHARSAAVLLEAEKRGATLLELAPKVFGMLADTITSQGLIAVTPIPHASLPSALTFVLVLDQVRDPGNMGTILRSAEAASLELVVLAPGCVDTWNPKVVRSGMGAHFRLPLLVAGSWDHVREAIAGLPVWLADAHAAEPYDRIDWTRPCALAIGGEAAGFSPEAKALGTGRVMIPMARPVESLNAAMAATILVFEAARQRRARVGEARIVG